MGTGKDKRYNAGLPVCNGYTLLLDNLERAGVLTGGAYTPQSILSTSAT